MSGFERWELVRVDKEMVERLLAEEPSRVMLVGLERHDDGTAELIFRTPDDQGAVEALEAVIDDLNELDGDPPSLVSARAKALDLLERLRKAGTND
jgi:hypothetical protein